MIEYEKEYDVWGMLQDHAIAIVLLRIQLGFCVTGTCIGKAKVPVGRAGRPVGDAVRGVASKVVVIVVVPMDCLWSLVRYILYLNAVILLILTSRIMMVVNWMLWL